MTAVVVERPLTAQQRVLTANNPPPPPPADQDMGHRRRAAVNSRGQSVAEVLLGNLVIDNASKCPKTAGNKAAVHTCPSDFLAGPKDPGHIKRGVRRFEDKNECVVAKALTEEWITGRKDGELLQRCHYRQRGPKDNLEGMSCSVKTEEAKQRKLRAPGNAPPHNTQAPYCEPGLGFVSEKPIYVGKRRFTAQSSVDSVGLALWGQDVPQQKKASMRRNKANESVDVLNLGQYTCKELNEHERKVLLGPRRISPGELPPRQRSIIARVKTHANETHDVFGTGCGVQEPEVVHRKNPGLSAPRRSNTVNIFEYVQPEQKQQTTHQPSRFLEHVEAESSEKHPQRKSEPFASSEPPRQALGKVELGLLFESKSPVVASRTGRSRGLYAPKTSTASLLL